MTSDKTTRQNRVREALGRLYDQHPPYFREYLRRFKEDPSSRVFAPLAEAYRRMGRVDEAIDICREGLEHHPDFHGGRVALAKCLVDKRMYEEARAELERVVQAVPENLLAQRLLGDTFLALADKGGALHCYKMALLLSPNDVSLAEIVHGLEKGTIQQAVPAAVPERPETIPLEEPPQKPVLPAALSSPIGESSEAPENVAGILGEGGFAPQDEDVIAALDERTRPGFSVGGSTEEPEVDEADHGKIDRLLGVDANEAEEPFKIEHVSAIFVEDANEAKREITTSTLGDLYFSQGQYDQALRIFEKLQSQRMTQDLARKINACRAKLGVDKDAIVRNRKIHMLRMILKKVRADERR